LYQIYFVMRKSRKKTIANEVISFPTFQKKNGISYLDPKVLKI
jgi:hypothetical protein